MILSTAGFLLEAIYEQGNDSFFVWREYCRFIILEIARFNDDRRPGFAALHGHCIYAVDLLGPFNDFFDRVARNALIPHFDAFDAFF